jgi:hypothetical protein
MSDLEHYVSNRKKIDPIFAEHFESDYEIFKLSVLSSQVQKFNDSFREQQEVTIQLEADEQCTSNQDSNRS